MPAQLGSGEVPLVVADAWLLMPSHVKGARELCVVPLIRALIPVLRAPPS